MLTNIKGCFPISNFFVIVLKVFGFTNLYFHDVFDRFEQVLKVICSWLATIRMKIQDWSMNLVSKVNIMQDVQNRTMSWEIFSCLLSIGNTTERKNGEEKNDQKPRPFNFLLSKAPTDVRAYDGTTKFRTSTQNSTKLQESRTVKFQNFDFICWKKCRRSKFRRTGVHHSVHIVEGT